jgi:hypothetical protein
MVECVHACCTWTCYETVERTIKWKLLSVVENESDSANDSVSKSILSRAWYAAIDKLYEIASEKFYLMVQASLWDC